MLEVVFALPVVARDPVEDQVVLLVLLEVVHFLLHVLKLHRHRLKVLVEILDAFLHVLDLLEERGLGGDGAVVDLGHVLHQVGVHLVRAVNEPSQSFTITEKVKDYNQQVALRIFANKTAFCETSRRFVTALDLVDLVDEQRLEPPLRVLPLLPRLPPEGAQLARHLPDLLLVVVLQNVDALTQGLVNFGAGKRFGEN